MSTPLTDQELAGIPTVAERADGTGLTWLSKQVYGVMRQGAALGRDRKDEAFMAPATIASKVGRTVAPESVLAAIAELCAKGFAFDTGRERGRQRVLRLLPGPDGAATRQDPESSAGSPPEGGIPAPDGDVGASPPPAEAGEAPTRRTARRPTGENLRGSEPDPTTYRLRCHGCEAEHLASELAAGFCTDCSEIPGELAAVSGPHDLLARLYGSGADDHPAAGRGDCDDCDRAGAELRQIGSLRVCGRCLAERLRCRERLAA